MYIYICIYIYIHLLFNDKSSMIKVHYITMNKNLTRKH